jgi:hypothetical protein
MAFMAPDCKNPENLDWLVVEPPTPLKNDGVKVRSDYEIPNCFWKKNKSKPPSSYYLARLCQKKIARLIQT